MDTGAPGERKSSARELQADLNSATKTRVLVLGGTGLIGREIVRSVLRKGMHPVILSRGSAPATEETRTLAKQGEFSFVEADLATADVDVLRRQIGRIDHVAHCAGYYQLPPSASAAQDGNVAAMRTVLRLCKAIGVTSITYVSTILVSGLRSGLVREEAGGRPPRFRNAYEETKWEAENLLTSQDDVAARIFRPGATLGNSMTGETTKFDGPYTAFGIIRPWLPFLIPRVDAGAFPVVTADLIGDAVAASVCDPPSRCEVYHAIDLQAPSLRGFAEAICARLGDERRVVEVPIPVFRALISAPGFSQLTGIPKASAEYLCSTTQYCTVGFARFCEEHDIDARRLVSGYEPVTDYYRRAKRRRGRSLDVRVPVGGRP